MTRGVMVVGMHRSGTSAVTRVVNLLGVPLGRADDIYSAKDNPSGHWESRQVCAVNNMIWRVFGGFDMAMPPMPRLWQQTRRSAYLRRVMGATFDVIERVVGADGTELERLHDHHGQVAAIDRKPGGRRRSAPRAPREARDLQLRLE